MPSHKFVSKLNDLWNHISFQIPFEIQIQNASQNKNSFKHKRKNVHNCWKYSMVNIVKENNITIIPESDPSNLKQ